MAGQICIARIGAAHGVRGAVKLWTFTEDPLAVARYGPLATKDGGRQFEVAHAREAKGHLVATLKGVNWRHCEERSEEAIQCAREFPDCFLEPVIGRRFAPTRWLAMTNEVISSFPIRESRQGPARSACR